MPATARIYPIYFNSRIKRSEGRRVPYDKTGAIPTLQNISKTLTMLDIQHTVEQKQHPKHSHMLSYKSLPKSSKIEEIERQHTSTGGSITIHNIENKRSIIKRVFEKLNK